MTNWEWLILGWFVVVLMLVVVDVVLDSIFR